MLTLDSGNIYNIHALYLPLDRLAHLHIRTNDNTKKKAKEILKSLGLDLSTAINMYLEKIVISESIPFTVCRHPTCLGQRKISNGTLSKWSKEEKNAIKEGKIFESAEDLFDSWDKE